MRILMWNVRGLGKAGRRKQVRDHILHNDIDVVGLQETVKKEFLDSDLCDLAGGLNFIWFWLEAKGKSGGMLVGVKIDVLEVEDNTQGEYSILITIRNRMSNYRWNLVIVYGPAQHDFSPDFIQELNNICSNSRRGGLPIVLGGDLNLIRNEAEKNSDNYNHSLMDLFNNFIGGHHLREVVRAGPKYTWSNKWVNPIMVNLDRFFISRDWENRFPLCMAWSLTRVGSDHSPIILDSGEQGAPRPRYFYFEKQWLLEPDFGELVNTKWQESKTRRPENSYSLDNWHGSLCYLRQALKGWNLRKIGEHKKVKIEPLQRLEIIDAQAEERDLSAEQWKH
jgi:exonuclease III